MPWNVPRWRAPQEPETIRESPWRTRPLALPAPEPVVVMPRSVPPRDLGIRAIASSLGRSLAGNVRISEARGAMLASAPSRSPYNTGDPFGFGYNPDRPALGTPASIPDAKTNWLPLVGLGVLAWILASA